MEANTSFQARAAAALVTTLGCPDAAEATGSRGSEQPGGLASKPRRLPALSAAEPISVLGE